MLTDGEFTEVLVLQVGEDLGLLGVGGVLKLELSDVGLAVLLSGVAEVHGLFDLVEDGGEVVVEVVDGTLELSVLGIELINTLFEVLLVGLLTEGEVVEGVDDGVTEVVKGFNDGSEGVLVGEVLVGGEAHEGLDHGGELSTFADLGLDLLERVLELLDLHEAWVREGLEEGEGLINGGGGTVQFLNLGFVGFMLLLANQGVLGEGLTVLVSVLLQLTETVLELVSAGDEEVGNGVLSAVDVDLGVLDVLLEADDLAVVLGSALSEVEFQLLEFLVQVADQLFNSLFELGNGALSHGVELHHV